MVLVQGNRSIIWRMVFVKLLVAESLYSVSPASGLFVDEGEKGNDHDKSYYRRRKKTFVVTGTFANPIQTLAVTKPRGLIQ
jgi:hypothetical protein